MEGAGRRLYGSLTPAQLTALDAAAAQLGVGVVQLMEVAGFQVARLAWRMLGSRPGRVHVVAGRGNNGGDGLVAARHLSAWGCSVSCAVLGSEATLHGVVRTQAVAARGAGVDVLVTPAPAALLRRDGADLVVDALLGVGLSGPPRPDAAEVISGMVGRVLSVDVPSGLNAGDGSAAGVVVAADATCTLCAVKSGLWETRDGVDAVGDLYVADIAMPRQAWTACGLTPPSAVRGGAIRRVRRS